MWYAVEQIPLTCLLLNDLKMLYRSGCGADVVSFVRLLLCLVDNSYLMCRLKVPLGQTELKRL